jgi:hypothetical protein
MNFRERSGLPQTTPSPPEIGKVYKMGLVIYFIVFSNKKS